MDFKSTNDPWDEPAEKKIKICKRTTTDTCVICEKGTEEALTEGTKSGIESLVESSSIRKDKLHEHLKYFLCPQSDNLDVSYHRSCFKGYTSKENLKYIATDSDLTEHLPSLLENEVVNWSCCILCKKKSYKKNKTLIKFSTKERVEKLFKASIERNDKGLENILKSNDLIAIEAVYHNTCMSLYLLKKTNTDDSDGSVYDQAFRKLVEIISADLLVRKKAFLMNDLLNSFRLLLPNVVDSTAYQSKRLQSKLLSYFGRSVIVQNQYGQGKSNIVMASNLTLLEAVEAVNALNQEINTSAMDSETSAIDICEDDSVILYKAAMILRTKIDSVKIPDDIYPPADQLSLQASFKIIPEELYQFVQWIIDHSDFEAVKHELNPTHDLHRKTLSICECLLFCSRKLLTPLHLGRGIQFHHEYGSKSLIDTLNSHGFCVSYDEIRRFLTSTALQEINMIQNDTYIPNGLIPVTNGGDFIQEGDDNIDINCETIDGKNSFHSMARVVFQKQSTDAFTVDIKRVDKKTLPEVPEAEHQMKCLEFVKPKQRPNPPRIDKALDQIVNLQTFQLETSELVWVLLRMVSRNISSVPLCDVSSDEQTIPFWTGFNCKTSEVIDWKTVASYAPVIDSKPSDMSTIYTTMKRCKAMTNMLGQTHSVQTMDLQLYSIAQQVKWYKKEEFDNHYVRLGGFHTACCFIASIGKIWGDGGLRDILIESDVYAPNTVDQIILGKQFKRGVRALTLLFESFFHLLVISFFKWCSTSNETIDIKDVLKDDFLLAYKSFIDSNDEKIHVEKLSQKVSDKVLPLFKRFTDDFCARSPTFNYWFIFLEAVQLLLSSIRAERQGDWDLHLKSNCSMLPFMFSANRANYARWLPIYILDMVNLPLEVKRAFLSGQFSFRETIGKFNGVWTDMAVEKTVIKDSKSDGGIVGITRKKQSLMRWTVTRHLVGQYCNEMKTRSCNRQSDSEHDQNLPSTMKRDEDDAQKIITHISNNLTNPFEIEEHPENLVNISTGLIATEEVQNSLLGCLSSGRRRLESFITSSLSTDSQGNFYKPISKSGLKTFADMCLSTKIKSSSGTVLSVHINPELVFRRALTLSRCRNEVTLLNVLSHPIGPVPTSLFHEDGSMRKTSKADLCHQLENEAKKYNHMDNSPSSTVYIRDAMAVIQTMDGCAHKTFGELALAYMRQFVSNTSRARTVVDVFDRYDNKDSVKSGERFRRAEKNKGSVREYQVCAGRPIPPWKKFLGSSVNKQSLTEILCTFLVNSLNATSNDEFIISGGFENCEKTVLINAKGIHNLEELQSTQEEADTRMILHHANEIFKRQDLNAKVIIKTPDTDVVVLAVHFFPKMSNISQLWIETGVITRTNDLRRYIPVHEICKALSPSTCEVLPAVHALTGCDSTSAFYGVGKKTVYKIMKSKTIETADLALFSSGDLETYLPAARRFVALLYDQKSNYVPCHKDLNILRARMATQKDLSVSKLPPCEDSFEEHIKRACWQTKIWLAADIAKPNYGDPKHFGWKRSETGQLVPVYFKGQMASEVLQHLFCSCSIRSSCSKTCVCKASNLPCIELCLCESASGCTNPNNKAVPEDDESSVETD